MQINPTMIADSDRIPFSIGDEQYLGEILEMDLDFSKLGFNPSGKRTDIQMWATFNGRTVFVHQVFNKVEASEKIPGQKYIDYIKETGHFIYRDSKLHGRITVLDPSSQPSFGGRLTCPPGCQFQIIFQVGTKYFVSNFFVIKAR